MMPSVDEITISAEPETKSEDFSTLGEKLAEVYMANFILLNCSVNSISTSVCIFGLEVSIYRAVSQALW